MTFKLRPYQEKALASILNNINAGNRLQAIVLATGLGKTVIFAQLPTYVKKAGKKTLVLAHREELLEQAKNKIEQVDPTLSVEIEQGSQVAEPDADVIIASVPTLGREGSKRIEKFNPDHFGLIIIDECFASGTKIGEKNIEDIKVGDIVDSYNEKTKTIEKNKVTRLFKKKATRFLKIAFSDNTKLICTENHPFFVNSKWVEAKKLTNTSQVYKLIANEKKLHDNQNMCGMSNGVSTEVLEFYDDSDMFREVQKNKKREEKKGSGAAMHDVWKNCTGKRDESTSTGEKRESLLQREMQKNSFKKTKVGSDGNDKQKIRIRENEEKQSNVFTERQGKTVKDTTKNATQTTRARGEWERNDATTKVTFSAIGKDSSETMESRVYSKDTPEKRKWLSIPLQNRLSRFFSKISSGIRWAKSHGKSKTETGQKKNKIITKVRVESIEILKQGGIKKYTDGYKYNFEVANNNNYFANNMLVHNCHHATAATYKRILTYFKSNKETGLAKKHPVVLGVTATPNRADNRGLSEVVDVLAFKYDIKDGIDDGYLAKIQAYTVFTGENVSASMRAGDFAIGELSEEINTEHRNQLIVDSYRKICDKEKALVFAVDVQHAQDLCQKFLDEGYNANYLIGATDKGDRKQILKDFTDGRLHVLINVGVLTEGYDEPSIRAILLARPTASGALFVQMVGRGTRLAPGKDHVKLLDFVDNWKKNRIVTASSLIGLEKPVPVYGNDIFELQEKYEELLASNPNADITKIKIEDLDERIKEIDIFADTQLDTIVSTESSNAWVNFLEGFKLSLGMNEEGHKIFTEIRQDAIGNFMHIVYRMDEVKPSFSNNWTKHERILLHEKKGLSDKIEAIREADKHLYANFKSQIGLVNQNAKWRKEPPTEKQLGCLKKFGYSEGQLENLTKGEASTLLSKCFQK